MRTDGARHAASSEGSSRRVDPCTFTTPSTVAKIDYCLASRKACDCCCGCRRDPYNMETKPTGPRCAWRTLLQSIYIPPIELLTHTRQPLWIINSSFNLSLYRALGPFVPSLPKSSAIESFGLHAWDSCSSSTLQDHQMTCHWLRLACCLTMVLSLLY